MSSYKTKGAWLNVFVLLRALFCVSLGLGLCLYLSGHTELALAQTGLSITWLNIRLFHVVVKYATYGNHSREPRARLRHTASARRRAESDPDMHLGPMPTIIAFDYVE